MPAVRDQRRHVRQASRARRRGGAGRGPVPVQRFARGVADTAGTVRDVGVAAVSGDRPYVVALIALLVAGGLMLVGPTRTFLDGRERVQLLEAQLDALTAENEELASAASELHDPEAIELRAREHLGMIRPGEVPYAIVPPPVDRPQIAPPREVAPPEAPWYRRWWDAATGIFG